MRLFMEILKLTQLRNFTGQAHGNYHANCEPVVARLRKCEIFQAREKFNSTMAASSVESSSDKEFAGVKIVIRCVAKGYQECRFQVKTGEAFTVVKKVGDRGPAFKIFDPKRGQLGHLQREFVPVLWPLTPHGMFLLSLL